MDQTRIKSPKYPNFPLGSAIEHIRKVYNADRTAALPREVIARHLGYSGLSGASDATIATIGQYGFLDRTGKGEMKVSQLAVDIIVPESETQRQTAINRAALNPPLFSDIWNHFSQRVPSAEALRTYLLRREFHDRAIDPVMRSFEPTMAMMKQPNETASGGPDKQEDRGSTSPRPGIGERASVGDYVQWETQGALRFDEPKRVRWVSEDGNWLAVDGSDTGIPMSEVNVEQRPATVPKAPPGEPAVNNDKHEPGFSEWFRVKVGPDKLVTINYKGLEEIGPREIEKMISILQAQKIALED